MQDSTLLKLYLFEHERNREQFIKTYVTFFSISKDLSFMENPSGGLLGAHNR